MALAAAPAGAVELIARTYGYLSTSRGWPIFGNIPPPFEFFGHGINSASDTTDGSPDVGFGYGGASCPGAGAPDFLCAHAYGHAAFGLDFGLVGSGLTEFATLTMSALANIEATDSQASLVDIRGETQATLPFGCDKGTVSLNDSYVFVLNMELNGTESAFSSAAAVQVTSSSTKSPLAPGCSGSCQVRLTTSCKNTTLPVGVLSLFTRALLKDTVLPPSSGYSATVVSDYAHTLKLVSVDILDSHDVPVPGVRAFVADDSGAPLYFFLTSAEAAQLPTTSVLRVSKVGSGTVQSVGAGIDCGTTCGARYPNDATVTLQATPGAGTAFVGWSGDCTGLGDCVVAMSAARDVTATFGAVATADLTVYNSGGGRIQSDPAGIDCGAVCIAPFTENSLVRLTATPDAGSVFAGWSGGCTGKGDCVLQATAGAYATALFRRPVDEAMLCYGAKPAKAPRGQAPYPSFVPRSGDVVLDARSSSLPGDLHELDLTAPARFCNPASVAFTDPGAVTDPGHLEGYKAKQTHTDPTQPKPAPLRSLLQDQFGAVALDLGAPSGLLLPAGAADGGAGAPPLAAGWLQALNCYAAKQAKAKKGEGPLPTFVPRSVYVKDGFAPGGISAPPLYDVTKPTRACLPASVNGIDPAAPSSTQTFVCYAVKLAKAKPAQAKFGGAVVSTSPPFGGEVLGAKGPVEVCVPAVPYGGGGG